VEVESGGSSESDDVEGQHASSPGKSVSAEYDTIVDEGSNTIFLSAEYGSPEKSPVITVLAKPAVDSALQEEYLRKGKGSKSISAAVSNPSPQVSKLPKKGSESSLKNEAGPQRKAMSTESVNATCGTMSAGNVNSTCSPAFPTDAPLLSPAFPTEANGESLAETLKISENNGSKFSNHITYGSVLSPKMSSPRIIGNAVGGGSWGKIQKRGKSRKGSRWKKKSENKAEDVAKTTHTLTNSLSEIRKVKDREVNREGAHLSPKKKKSSTSDVSSKKKKSTKSDRGSTSGGVVPQLELSGTQNPIVGNANDNLNSNNANTQKYNIATDSDRVKPENYNIATESDQPNPTPTNYNTATESPTNVPQPTPSSSDDGQKLPQPSYSNSSIPGQHHQDSDAYSDAHSDHHPHRDSLRYMNAGSSTHTANSHSLTNQIHSLEAELQADATQAILFPAGEFGRLPEVQGLFHHEYSPLNTPGESQQWETPRDNSVSHTATSAKNGSADIADIIDVGVGIAADSANSNNHNDDVNEYSYDTFDNSKSSTGNSGWNKNGSKEIQFSAGGIPFGSGFSQPYMDETVVEFASAEGFNTAEQGEVEGEWGEEGNETSGNGSGKAVIDNVAGFEINEDDDDVYLSPGQSPKGNFPPIELPVSKLGETPARSVEGSRVASPDGNGELG